MPLTRVDSASLYYEDQGAGPETVVFAHGLIWSCRIYDQQVASLKDAYRCVTFDFRGQGESEVTKDGYDMETLFDDTVGLIKALNCAPCHFVGHSMGGFIGLRLAARRPELLRSLILLGTSAEPETPEVVARYKPLTFIVRWFGLGLLTGRVMSGMFGKKFMTDPSRAEERRMWKSRMAGNNRVGITKASMGVVTRKGVQDELVKIRVPTLVLVGDQDTALPLPNSQRLAEGIQGSKLVIIPGAGHTSTVEEPEAVKAAIINFLAEQKRG